MKPIHYLFTYRNEEGEIRNFSRASKQGLAAQKRWFSEQRGEPFGYILIKVEEDWTRKCLEELRKDPANMQRLQDKCRWEQMSLTAVLLEWGDPRTW